MNGSIFLLVLSLLVCGLAYADTPIVPSTVVPPAEVVVKRENYEKARAELEQFRGDAAKLYAKADAEGRRMILDKTRSRLEETLANEIFPAWYGTPWDFNGVSVVPGEGHIACGYFVSTCLLHAGFHLPRIKLSQQASQKIIETFVDREGRIVTVGKPIEDFVTKLRTLGDGLYIVGLDTHVGFIFVRGETMSFVHSNYYQPDQLVKSETVRKGNPLGDSNYRIAGKLFSDLMLVKWLNGEAFIVR